MDGNADKLRISRDNMAPDDVRIADFCCVKTTSSSSCCASRQKSVVGQPVIVQKFREFCLNGPPLRDVAGEAGGNGGGNGGGRIVLMAIC